MKTIRMKSNTLPWDDKIIHCRDIEVGSYSIKNGKEIPGKPVMMTEYMSLYWMYDYESRNGDKRRHRIHRMFMRIQKEMYDNLIKNYSK